MFNPREMRLTRDWARGAPFDPRCLDNEIKTVKAELGIQNTSDPDVERLVERLAASDLLRRIGGSQNGKTYSAS